MSNYPWFITIEDLIADFLLFPVRTLAADGVPAVDGDLLCDLDYD